MTVKGGRVGAEGSSKKEKDSWTRTTVWGLLRGEGRKGTKW